MDFLKTLLIYMSATMALAVQSTTAPEPTPVPTPSPTPAIEATATETPVPLVISTAEPEATVSVTPEPVPTITPNRAYHNLQQGDRGTEVRRLQERLIELGYLPEGAADGAYGGQTRNAVRRFQYYNSLTQDGIAGRATQTNLFENPDVRPMPTETPAAEETPEPAEETPAAEETPEPAEPEEIPNAELTEMLTAEPTEAPTAEPTADQTEAPTAEPTAAPTEAPTAEPTADPTEAPTAEPTAEPTEAPTAEPTAAPTAEPTAAPTEAPTAEPTVEPTEAPTAEASTESTTESTEAPTAEPEAATTETESGTEPEEIIENVELDDEDYTEIQGSVVLNDNGSAMEWTDTEDGVPVVRRPRLQRNDEAIRISLDDLARCVPEWILTDDGDTIVLEAAGYTLGLYNEDAGIVATVDGLEIADMPPASFSFSQEGHFIDVNFLAGALGGEALWEEEESTLMLRIPGKVLSEALDG